MFIPNYSGAFRYLQDRCMTPVMSKLTPVLVPTLIASVFFAGETLSAVESPVSNGAGIDRNAVQLINIETNEKPLEIVLSWISRRAGVNIVCNEPDQPLVTMRLVNVTWQEAIEQISTRYDMVIEKKSDRIWELTNPPRVRMQFQDAELTRILEALARQSGMNVVISDDVDASRRLTMTLNGVPWREALNVIVRATGYAWTEHNYNIIRIISRDNVQRDMETRVYHINYGDGETLTTSIQVALSGEAQIQFDTRANALIMTDTAAHLDAALRLLKELDTRTREVQMSIRFVDYSTTDASKLGFNSMGLGFDVDSVGGFTTAFLPLNASSDAGLSLNGVRTGGGPAATRFNSASFSFEALSSLNSTEVIQAPSILTLDNTIANMRIGRDIAYAETTQSTEGGVSTSTIAAGADSPVSDGITLEVQPRITADGYVSIGLNIQDSLVELKEFSNGTQSIQLPETQTKHLETKIMVRDGDTAVIGGMLSNRVTEDDRQIPVLGSIPILGLLFRHESETVEQRNLTIFVTPRIVRLGDDDELEERRLRIRERLSGLDLTPDDDEQAAAGIGY